jgi:CCR4-NOT transcriptional regulation complex NOT5 subunit
VKIRLPQKLRDQVKTWAAGPEIKNKQQLTEARDQLGAQALPPPAAR